MVYQCAMVVHVQVQWSSGPSLGLLLAPAPSASAGAFAFFSLDFIPSLKNITPLIFSAAV